MLGSVKVEGQWSVLLMDNVTTQIMTNVCGVADLMDYGISCKKFSRNRPTDTQSLSNSNCFFSPITVVDNVAVPRQPAPHLNGVYYITPTEESVRALVSDFTKRGRDVQHRKVHVFFSSAVDPALLHMIRGCPKLLERVETMKEVNLEYLLFPDNRSFTTGQEYALPAFFSASVDSTEEYRVEIQTMAARLATMFATMKEFPTIRFRAALPPGEEHLPGLESRLLVAQRLAVELYESLLQLQGTGHIPERETCELIITDRGFDPVAPVIHEWTYEAMTHDLLEDSPALKGKVYTYDSESRVGKREPKEHVLDERDPMHVELRHLHFAAASLRISSAMNDLRARSRLGGARGSSNVSDLDLKGMSKLVQALPQYQDQLATIGAHVELASALNRVVDTRQLVDLGKLEQDLVYGDATSKEVIAFLSANQMLPEADKLRVLMCYSATHQEKLDATRASQWQKVARLPPENMSTIVNLEYLGVPVCKRQRGGALATLTFGRRRRRAVRKDREAGEDEGQYALSRFVPLLSEVLEDAATGRLSQEEYPYVIPPTVATANSFMSIGASFTENSAAAAQAGGLESAASDTASSFRTIRSTSNWAKKASGGGGSGGAAPTPVDHRKADVNGNGGGRGGSKMFAFIIGGFTYSELRVVHRLAARSGRDVILGGTSIQTPANFMRQVVSLGSEDGGQESGPPAVEQPPPPPPLSSTGKLGLSVRRKK